MTAARARHDRPDPRLLGHAPELGALDRALRGQAATASSRPPTPGFEVEVEALNADPTPIESVTVPAIIEHLEARRSSELDTPPILMGHSAGGVFTQILLDRGYGAAGVAINSAPTEGVARRAAVADQGDVPGAEEPRQPPQGGRLHARAVALRVHQHVQRGGVAAALRALPHPGVRRRSSGAACSRTSSPATRTTLGRLQERRPRAAAVHLRQRGPPDAAVDPAVERQALQVRHDHRGQGVRGPAPAAGAGGLGGGRRLRARLGAEPRRRQPVAA